MISIYGYNGFTHFCIAYKTKSFEFPIYVYKKTKCNSEYIEPT